MSFTAGRYMNFTFGVRKHKKSEEQLRDITRAIVARYARGSTAMQDLQQGYITEDEFEEIKLKVSRKKISY
jgi:hypothetical protein